MLNKIKGHINKKYATISVYVIITAAIICILARATIQIEYIFGAAIGLLKYVGKLLIPVFIGAIIAYIIDPMVVFTEKMYKKIKFLKFRNEKRYRTIAVFTCILVIILVISLLIRAFIFSVTKQFSNIDMDKVVYIITSYINGFSNSLINLQSRLKELNIDSTIIQQYSTRFSDTLTSWLNNFADNLAENTMNISSHISNFIFGLIIGIYFLLDKEDLLRYWNKLLEASFSENSERKIKSYLKDLGQIFSGYIRGTLLDALFMCVAFSLSLTIIGIKFGPLIGIFAGLCHLVPYLGPVVAFAGTIIFGIINAQYSQVITAIIVLFIIQQIDVNIIQPKLIGKRVSLKPIFILIAILIGAEINGIIGMVLAVPVAAVIKLFFKKAIDERLIKKELMNEKYINIDKPEIQQTYKK